MGTTTHSRAQNEGLSSDPADYAVIGAITADDPTRTRIITFATPRGLCSTAVDEQGIEHPEVAQLIDILVMRGDLASLVVRTFGDEIAYTIPGGTSVPFKEVAGWLLDSGTAKPLSAQQCMDAHCSNTETGAILSPERGVTYKDAPDLDLSGLFPAGSRR